MLPAPQEAIMNIYQLSFDNASFANPFFVPSLSMEVNRISPAPLVDFFAQSNKFNSVGTLLTYQMNNHRPSFA
jgi:hypothetical protein